jgi:hypothetical protein
MCSTGAKGGESLKPSMKLGLAIIVAFELNDGAVAITGALGRADTGVIHVLSARVLLTDLGDGCRRHADMPVEQIARMTMTMLTVSRPIIAAIDITCVGPALVVVLVVGGCPSLRTARGEQSDGEQGDHGGGSQSMFHQAP